MSKTIKADHKFWQYICQKAKKSKELPSCYADATYRSNPIIDSTIVYHYTEALEALYRDTLAALKKGDIKNAKNFEKKDALTPRQNQVTKLDKILRQFIQHDILSHQSNKKRVHAFKRWLDIAKRLKDKKLYGPLEHCVSSIASYKISHLDLIQFLPNAYRTLYQNLLELTSPNNNFNNLRKLKNFDDKDAIPSFSVLVKDMLNIQSVINHCNEALNLVNEEELFGVILSEIDSVKAFLSERKSAGTNQELALHPLFLEALKKSNNINIKHTNVHSLLKRLKEVVVKCDGLVCPSETNFNKKNYKVLKNGLNMVSDFFMQNRMLWLDKPNLFHSKIFHLLSKKPAFANALKSFLKVHPKVCWPQEKAGVVLLYKILKGKLPSHRLDLNLFTSLNRKLNELETSSYSRFLTEPVINLLFQLEKEIHSIITVNTYQHEVLKNGLSFVNDFFVKNRELWFDKPNEFNSKLIQLLHMQSEFMSALKSFIANHPGKNWPQDTPGVCMLYQILNDQLSSDGLQLNYFSILSRKINAIEKSSVQVDEVKQTALSYYEVLLISHEYEHKYYAQAKYAKEKIKNAKRNKLDVYFDIFETIAQLKKKSTKQNGLNDDLSDLSYQMRELEIESKNNSIQFSRAKRNKLTGEKSGTESQKFFAYTKHHQDYSFEPRLAGKKN